MSNSDFCLLAGMIYISHDCSPTFRFVAGSFFISFAIVFDILKVMA